jgi:hypothetical protein
MRARSITARAMLASVVPSSVLPSSVLVPMSAMPSSVMVTRPPPCQHGTACQRDRRTRTAFRRARIRAIARADHEASARTWKPRDVALVLAVVELGWLSLSCAGSRRSHCSGCRQETRACRATRAGSACLSGGALTYAMLDVTATVISLVKAASADCTARALPYSMPPSRTRLPSRTSAVIGGARASWWRAQCVAQSERAQAGRAGRAGAAPAVVSALESKLRPGFERYIDSLA